MFFYANNGEILNTDFLRYFDEGTKATIYMSQVDKNTLFKYYKNDCKIRFYMSKRIFDMIKKAELPNIVKLKNYYFNTDNKISHILLPMNGYTMELVKEDNINLITSNKEYLEKIINQMETTIRELSKLKIRIDDAHSGNIIFNEDSATLIDLDQYTLENSNTYIANKKSLYEFFNSRINRELSEIFGLSCNNFIKEKNEHNSFRKTFFYQLKQDTILDQIKCGCDPHFRQIIEEIETNKINQKK